MKQLAWLALALVGCSSESQAATGSTSSEPLPSASSAPSAQVSASSSSASPPTQYEAETLPELDDDPKTLGDQHAAILRRMKALGKGSLEVDPVAAWDSELQPTSASASQASCFTMMRP